MKRYDPDKAMHQTWCDGQLLLFFRDLLLSFFNCGGDWVCVCAQVLSETTGVLSPGAAVRGSYELDNVSTGN